MDSSCSFLIEVLHPFSQSTRIFFSIVNCVGKIKIFLLVEEREQSVDIRLCGNKLQSAPFPSFHFES